MKKLLLLFSALLILTACSKDDESDFDINKPFVKTTLKRTVLVYISGENNLSDYIPKQLEDMKAGSYNLGNNALVVYVDGTEQNTNVDSAGQKTNLPYIARIVDGEMKDSITLYDEDPLSSDPEVMKRIIDFAFFHYPAEEYGLVLWGHANGWVEGDSAYTPPIPTANKMKRAFGIDNGLNSRYSTQGRWINTPTLAKVLEACQHLKFIFADCCQFQCIENAYELRNTVDFIIASPAEIPGEGAPYNLVVPCMFDPTATFYEKMADAYFSQVTSFNYIVSDEDGWVSTNYGIFKSQVPLSVVKTVQLEPLATATRTLMGLLFPDTLTTFPNLERRDLIYYYGNVLKPNENMMYDMNDVLLSLSNEKGFTYEYIQWKEMFDKAVIYRLYPHNGQGWTTNKQVHPKVFNYLSDERYGGVSMYFPQNRTNTWYSRYEAYIDKLAWYHAIHQQPDTTTTINHSEQPF